MKKIIDAKLYNTETAAYVASYTSDYSLYDFHYYKETLYKTKKGNYFMHGEGGGLSPYAEYVEGSGSTYGERLIPLTREEAMDWAEKHMYVDDFVEEFGDVEEA